MAYDHIERGIIEFLQADIPLAPRPYRYLSEELGCSEEEIISRIIKMKNRGLIKRLGAVLRHQKAGFTVNAMVAWKVDENTKDQAGQIMADFNEVSHCYLREVPEDFGYNLFSMIHARSEEELSELIDNIARQTGLKDYIIIRSVKEYKKTSMKYF
jgi:DNA-binding Lrp family transcriptional regulator